MNGRLMALPGSNLLLELNDLIFPSSCLICGASGKFVCNYCSGKIITDSYTLCPICKTEYCQKHHQVINRLWALDDYHEPGINALVTSIKYKYIIGLLEEFWREKIEAFCLKNPELVTNKILIPIPLHRQKLLHRGFNQSELIAGIFADYCSSKVNKKLLVRVKNNLPQAEQKGSNRIENVKGIFKLDYRAFADCWGKEIVIVDDVYTTGATALEAAKELNKYGFNKIDCIVLAVSRS